ncbi:MAG: DinB family protein [Acidobacteria bacterium]|nr:DinB family protein [Acidobacteriota bacterium]
MSTALPEPWLRGLVPGIPALLQPVAHAFVMAREDVELSVRGLSAAQIWTTPQGVASLGFHLAHLAGSTDRLLTYARGLSLDEAQKAVLGRERTLAVDQPSIDTLLATWQATVERALAQLAATPESSLTDPRTVGRAKLSSTVLGLLFHAAEHASRHTGQVVTTARFVRAIAEAQTP